MFLMFIVYSNAVDEEMVEIVKEIADGFTKFINVQGEGSGEPHLGTHIWPSINNCMMIAIDKKKEKDIINAVNELKDKFEGVGISIFTTDLKKMA